MPEQVDSCVQAMLSKWKKDPASRPSPRERGQDAESQAYAICTAAAKRARAMSLEAMLADGHGPVLIGAAATNRPYIPHLKETEVVEIDGKEMLRVNLALSGFFDHPLGPFVLNRVVFLSMISNFDANVLGQRVAYDCRHRPDEGAHGWFVKLMVDGGGFYGLVEPTEVGLKAAKGRGFLYTSMEFHQNYKRSDVVLDLERAGELDIACLVKPTEMEGEMGKENCGEGEAGKLPIPSGGKADQPPSESADPKILELEQRLAASEARAANLEREAVESSVQAIVSLAMSHKDEKGNGHPRQLADWLSSVLRFGDIGEGDGTIRLSEDAGPADFRRYLCSAAKKLILSMPGAVPTKHETQTGAGSEEDEFNYKEEWEG